MQFKRLSLVHFSISIKYIISIYIIALIAMQLVFGNANVVFFKMPLNIAIISFWLIFLTFFRKSEIIKKLSGKGVGITAIIFIIACSLILGFASEQFSANFTKSWIMIGSILLMITSLWLVILRKLSLKNTGFLLSHFGLLLVLISALFGSADIEKLRTKLNKDDVPTSILYNSNGVPTSLNFNILLSNFLVEYYPNGSPLRYMATITLSNTANNNNNYSKTTVKLEVNHPAHYKGYDIYLISYGEGYCIIELQKQPWKYPLATGIVIMLAGAIFMFIKKDNVE